jgi:GAF domain-containing protein
MTFTLFPSRPLLAASGDTSPPASQQAEELLVQRLKQFEAVRTVTAEITRELDLTAVLDLITRRAVELVDAAEMGAIYLWDKTGEALRPPAWHGFGAWIREVAIRPGEGIVGAVVQNRQGLLVNDYQASLYAHPIIVQRTHTTAVLAEPLLYHDRLIGVILLNNGTSGRPFTVQDQDLLTIFGAQAATAIEHARLYEALESQGKRQKAYDLLAPVYH